MSALTVIDTIEAQHRALEKEIGVLDAALTGGDATAALASLGRLGHALVAHVTMENARFYPPLLALAEGKPEAQSVALFKENLDRIAEGAVAFVGRWKDGITDVERFKGEWKTTVEVLAARIKQEEQTLHPLVKRLST